MHALYCCLKKSILLHRLCFDLLNTYLSSPCGQEDAYLHVGPIFVNASSIGHNIQKALVCAGHYQVIKDSSLLIGEDSECPCVVLQPCDVSYHQLLHHGAAVCSAHVGLQHVRHIENPHRIPHLVISQKVFFVVVYIYVCVCVCT